MKAADLIRTVFPDAFVETILYTKIDLDQIACGKFDFDAVFLLIDDDPAEACEFQALRDGKIVSRFRSGAAK
jgi:hypothetical protein